MDRSGIGVFNHRGFPSSKDWLCDRICCKSDKVWGFLYTRAIVLVLLKNSKDNVGHRFLDRLLIFVSDCSYGIFNVF